MRQPVTYRTVELHADAPGPLAPGVYALRLCAGRVVGVHGPMRPGPRQTLLPHEFAEFPYQTSPPLLAAIERTCSGGAAFGRSEVPRDHRHLALAVSACLFASCALSWLLSSA